MPDTTKAPAANESSLTEQVSETFGNLKDEAAKLGDQLKDTAEDAWEKVKAIDVKGEFNHLKEEASETIEELADKAKGLWDKITGHETPPEAPEKRP